MGSCGIFSVILLVCGVSQGLSAVANDPMQYVVSINLTQVRVGTKPRK